MTWAGIHLVLPSENALIFASGLTKSYQRSETRVHAIKELSFEIPSNCKVALLGKSGSGKSTLLNLLAGLDHPTSGTLKVDGLDLATCSRLERDQYRREKIGIIFQQFRLINHRTAAQNVELPLMLAGVNRKRRQELVSDSLEKVGLQSRASHFPHELSGGEQQRIAIARAIIHSPKILLADEPTGNLDSANSDRIMEILNDLHDQTQMNLIMVTHDEQQANELTDQIIRLADGEIITSTVDQVVPADCAIEN